MVVVLKGRLRPRMGFDRREKVKIINGYLSPIWPNEHFTEVQKVVENWLNTAKVVDLYDQRVDLQVALMEEALIASHCRAKFRRVSDAIFHEREPWFSLWGTLTSPSFCASNLVEVLYSPEWEVGILRRAVRLEPRRRPGRAYAALIRKGIST